MDADRAYFLAVGAHPGTAGLNHADARDIMRRFPNRAAERVIRRAGAQPPQFPDTDPLNWPSRQNGLAMDGDEIDNHIAAGRTMYTAPNPNQDVVGMVELGVPNPQPYVGGVDPRDDVDREEHGREEGADIINLNRPPPIPGGPRQDPRDGMIQFRPQQPGAAGPQINRIHDGAPPDPVDQYHQQNNEGMLGRDL